MRAPDRFGYRVNYPWIWLVVTVLMTDISELWQKEVFSGKVLRVCFDRIGIDWTLEGR